MLNDYERKGIFKAIFERRDIRSFNRKPISKDKLNNILMAGHHAPSVGFMQPWDLIVIDSQEVKERLTHACHKEIQALSMHYEDEKKEKISLVKIRGYKESTYNALYYM